jgi:hypothetical protein
LRRFGKHSATRADGGAPASAVGPGPRASGAVAGSGSGQEGRLGPNGEWRDLPKSKGINTSLSRMHTVVQRPKLRERESSRRLRIIRRAGRNQSRESGRRRDFWFAEGKIGSASKILASQSRNSVQRSENLFSGSEACAAEEKIAPT